MLKKALLHPVNTLHAKHLKSIRDSYALYMKSVAETEHQQKVLKDQASDRVLVSVESTIHETSQAQIIQAQHPDPSPTTESQLYLLTIPGASISNCEPSPSIEPDAFLMNLYLQKCKLL
jgi:hypothetical protein